MLNWIETWFKRGTGLIASTALRWIHVALHAIAGVIHTVFGQVTAAWQLLAGAFWYVFGEVVYTARLVFLFLHWAVNTAIPALVKYAYTIGHDLWHEVSTIYNWIAREVKAFYDSAVKYAEDLWNWAYKHVVKPIEDSLINAWDWITKRGEQLWYYLTHPDKLMDLLLHYLAGSLMRASDTVLVAIGDILMFITIKNIPRWAHLIERVLTDSFL